MQKRLKIIIACILSLTIIYVGAGVNMAHCGCGCKSLAAGGRAGCPCCCSKHQKATDKSCCKDGQCKHAGKYASICKANCCKSLIYKVDLQKESPDLGIHLPVLACLPNNSQLAIADLQAITLDESSCSDPPSPASSRFYLNLYSTLLI